jgi:hypothetical protein
MLGIRAARTDELERLREIELDAGGAFAEIGMREIATDEPLQASELLEFIAAGRMTRLSAICSRRSLTATHTSSR